MAYKYTHFIPQNIAPSGAKSISVCDSNGNKIHTISLGRLKPPTKEKLYSFGILSDIHVHFNPYVAWQPISKFDNALTYFENKGCAFCVACGDLTNTGFYLRTNESVSGTEYLDEQQFAKYKEICDKHTIPVYELMGNHESYYGMPITNNLDKLETYTGKGVLSYTIEQGNDLFILCGQPKDAWVMSDADFTWLIETLETNKNKRCFVFVHSYIEEDSGDATDIRENSIFESWSKKSAFMSLLRQYPNAILFHGHSHMMFESQQYDDNANYTERNGFKSVHIPSSGVPRELFWDDVNKKYYWQAKDGESQGYIVDVYDDCIVLNGIDLINNKPIPLGTFKIDIKGATV